MEQIKDVPAFIRQMYTENYFMNDFGVHIDKIECGHVVISIDIVKEKHFNHRGVLHGGVMTALADSVLGVTGMSVGARVASMCFTMNFIHPVAEETRLRVESRITHDGRTTMIIESRMFDANDTLIATMSNTMFILKRLPEVPRQW